MNTTYTHAPTELQRYGCEIPYLKFEKGKYYPFPCGKCLYCRQQKANAWRLRLELEFTSWEVASFLTCTYKELSPFDKDFEKSRNLDYKDCQNFMKRARKLINKKFKFFVAGEYGKNGTRRAHWHYLIFGLNADETAKIAEKWGWGITDTQEVSGIDGVARYVSSYVLDKVDLNTQEYYDKHNQKPPFHRGSLGLGLESAILYFGNAYKNQWEHYKKTGIKLPIVWQGREVYLPRYLRNKICEIYEILDEVKAEGLANINGKLNDCVRAWKTFGSGELRKDTPKGKYDKPYSFNPEYDYDIMRESWRFIHEQKINSKKEKFLKFLLDKETKSVI